jgi:hypothetical protein
MPIKRCLNLPLTHFRTRFVFCWPLMLRLRIHKKLQEKQTT